MSTTATGRVVCVDDDERSHSDALRDLLLRSTLLHARDANDFYKARFAHTPIEDIGLDDLRHLPVLSKAELTRHYDRICRPKSFPAVIMYTSGTEGCELMVPVSSEEISATERLLGDAISFDNGPHPLTLTLVRVGHGNQYLPPKAAMIPAHITYGPEQVLSLLEKRYNFPGAADRITVLEGNLLTHMKFVDMLRDAGIDGRSFKLELVLTTGWYVTPHKRRTIEDFWGAPLLDRYGVTEINGDAKQCPKCGGFHFDPFVIAEAVDPLSGREVERGPASLILTGLFPFNQVAPKIRYAIGDLVERDPRPPCGLKEPAYRFLGREMHSIFRPSDNGTEYILFPTEVADVIDDYPEAVRRKETGFLCFTSEWMNTPKPVVVTRIEWHGNDREQEIRRAILARSSSLRRAVNEGVCNFQVELVQPGLLKAIAKL